MKILILILLFVAPLFTFSQDYKVGEAYIIQELIASSDPALVHYLRIYKMNTKGDLRVVSEKDLLDFVKRDAVDHDKLIYLFHSALSFKLNNDHFPEHDNFSDFVGIFDILLMQDVPIYKIGGKLYLIRKLRYAYIDDVDVFSRKDDLFHSYIYRGIDEPDVVDSTMVSAKSFFNIDYFQYFLFNMEILPNHKKLNKVFWKRRYEAVLLEPWGNRK
jgi:hypothetical protein